MAVQHQEQPNTYKGPNGIGMFVAVYVGLLLLTLLWLAVYALLR